MSRFVVVEVEGWTIGPGGTTGQHGVSCHVLDRACAHRISASFASDDTLVRRSPHGTVARYRSGCRCPACVADTRAYRAGGGTLVGKDKAGWRRLGVEGARAAAAAAAERLELDLDAPAALSSAPVNAAPHEHEREAAHPADGTAA